MRTISFGNLVLNSQGVVLHATGLARFDEFQSAMRECLKTIDYNFGENACRLSLKVSGQAFVLCACLCWGTIALTLFEDDASEQPCTERCKFPEWEDAISIH
jgi:hypothetical protein